MHAYQSQTPQDIVHLPPTPDMADIAEKLNTLYTPDTPYCMEATQTAPSCSYTPSGKIRRVPAAIRLQPYELDTAITPATLATAEQAVSSFVPPLQNAALFDAPQTPPLSLPQAKKETPVMHSLPMRPAQEKSSHGSARNAARAIHIPPMMQYSEEPDEGEVLLGCCVLLMVSIIISCTLYYFLIHIH